MITVLFSWRVVCVALRQRFFRYDKTACPQHGPFLSLITPSEHTNNKHKFQLYQGDKPDQFERKHPHGELTKVTSERRSSK